MKSQVINMYAVYNAIQPNEQKASLAITGDLTTI
jgi:hypothetical protein